MYIGETGRSAYERMREHFHNFNNKLEPKIKTNTDDIEEGKDDKDKKDLWKAIKTLKGKFTPRYIQMKNRKGTLVPLKKGQRL